MSSHKDYAVVNVAGRQFCVSEGDVIQANYAHQAKPGSTLSFDVLLLKKGANLSVGTPLVKGARVTAEVLGHLRAKKILVLKYLRKNKSKKLRGHRQPYTKLSITKVEG